MCILNSTSLRIWRSIVEREEIKWRWTCEKRLDDFVSCATVGELKREDNSQTSRCCVEIFPRRHISKLARCSDEWRRHSSWNSRRDGEYVCWNRPLRCVSDRKAWETKHRAEKECIEFSKTDYSKSLKNPSRLARVGPKAKTNRKANSLIYPKRTIGVETER